MGSPTSPADLLGGQAPPADVLGVGGSLPPRPPVPTPLVLMHLIPCTWQEAGCTTSQLPCEREILDVLNSALAHDGGDNLSYAILRL